MNDRSNTIAGWVLGAGIAALGLSIAFGEVFHAETPKVGEQGYAPEGVESSEGGGEAAVPLANLLAAADVAEGEKVFKKCVACHTIAQGGANGIGPNLWAALGKTHGHAPGFAYSDALKSVPGVWDFEGMNKWLTSPKKYAPGTKMSFAGLGKPEDRANLIVYLNSQGSNLPLPAPVAAGAEPAPADGAAAAPADAKAGAEAPAAAPAGAEAPAPAAATPAGAEPAAKK
ncbi:c-type cytochrome [Sphingorhabdus arenilitoris]|uniref:C-type cytochrome n=1 Tax=Sphingorhabdus arenilitoris TaxID=1490041 RepID=A0ABV8RF72_9SPHN